MSDWRALHARLKQIRYIRYESSTRSIEERVRREYQRIAPYMERIETLARIHAKLTLNSNNVTFDFAGPNMNGPGQDPRYYTLEFDADGSASIRDNDEEEGVSTLVEREFEMSSTQDVIALARLISQPRFRDLWKATEWEALITSNMTLGVDGTHTFSSRVL